MLHTAEVHVATFDTLRETLAPGLALRHLVRPDWLAEARAGRAEALRPQIAALIAGADGPVVCTCTTLGPLAEELGALRVDRPMMQQAARIGRRILMVYVLESTRAPSLGLLESLTAPGAEVRPLPLPEAWPLFETGDSAAFHAHIAEAIRTALRDGGVDVVVLAQASMAGAAALLGDLGLPVLTSPHQAMRALSAG